jgi:hypothetical protein
MSRSPACAFFILTRNISLPMKMGTMVTTKMVPPVSEAAAASVVVVLELLLLMAADTSELLLLLLMVVVVVLLGINRVVLHINNLLCTVYYNQLLRS